ncbi:hypothetical protein [Variovorax sp. PCZ-1]|uniref:hypothetical protein n=1 Tax=Variovorax sp. PCZ-1 TaxID=2835533 RepID=UPI001BCD6F33|nr:hypothetical protein [Variovorax sp. PCZ-1]MBS7806044.1 hypothetical protein [Variovorax sp. PCZ-1]
MIKNACYKMISFIHPQVRLGLKISVLPVLLGLVSCAPTAPYVNAVAANAARVEIDAQGVNANNWTLYTFDKGDTCQGRKIVGGSSSNKTAEIRIEPDKRHSYALYLQDGGYTCSIAVSFEAKASNIYGLRMFWDQQRCYMIALNTTKSIAGDKEPSAARRTLRAAFVEADPWCTPLNSADLGKPMESSSSDPNRAQVPKTPDGSRSGTSLDDLKDLLPKQP